MTATRTITDVRPIDKADDLGGTEPAWVVDIAREDGVAWCYAFPHSAFEHRAAEYGINPYDADTLTDVILQEFVMMDYGLGVDHNDPTFVYNTDEGSARTAHLKRVSDSKSIVAHVDPEGKLLVIKRRHLASVNMDSISQKKKNVASLRKARMAAFARR